MDAIDYIYYRIYKFFSVHKSKEVGEYEVRFGSIIVYNLILLIPILTSIIAPLLRAYGIKVPMYSETRFMLGILMLVLMIPIWVRYRKKEKVQELVERWGKEDPKQRVIRGWLIWALIINNLILIPLFVILLEHYNII